MYIHRLSIIINLFLNNIVDKAKMLAPTCHTCVCKTALNEYTNESQLKGLHFENTFVFIQSLSFISNG